MVVVDVADLVVVVLVKAFVVDCVVEKSLAGWHKGSLTHLLSLFTVSFDVDRTNTKCEQESRTSPTLCV